MRRVRNSLGLAVAVCLCCGASAPALSLRDVAERACMHNKGLAIQANEVQAAWSRVVQAQSGYLPQLSVEAGYTHNGSILPLKVAGKKDSGVYTGYADDNRVGLSLWHSLYNGGAVNAQVKSALLEHMSQEEVLRGASLDVEFEAKRLYYGLLLAYETERISQRLVNQAQLHYQNVRHKFDQGAASQFDLLQSKVQVARVTPELVRASNAVVLIKAELKRLMGMPLQEEVEVSGKLEAVPMPVDEGESLRQAYLENPEMIVKSFGVDISKWQVARARAGGLPQVSASAGYGYHSSSLGNIFDNRHSNWQAGLAISIPVFDGFSSKGKVDEAKARYSQALLDKSDLVDRIALEVKQACLDMRQSQAIIDSQKESVGSAQEALRIAEVSYDNGEATNLDILDAQVALAQIEKNLSEGTYDYLMAKAQLERSMARFLEQEEPFNPGGN